MNAEMFTTAASGGWTAPWRYNGVSVDTSNLPAHQQVAVIKLAHSVKWAAKAAFLLLVILVIVQFTNAIPTMWKAWRKLVKGDLSSFTQKEGLQYLGASTDIIRGDLEQNQDSLAEKALRQQAQVTDMTPLPVKATFRERASDRELTPEEQLARQQQGQ